MFFSRHLYIVILCYVLLILGVAGTGLVLIVTHTGIIIGCLIIIISFFITGALVKRLNKSNAKLKLFFDAIEDKENMIQFNEYSGDREMNALSCSLNRINELLATAKSDSQKQEKFYYSLLEEIPSGIIAWNSEGKIILANSTALSLLGFEQLVFVRQLKQLYPEIRDFLQQNTVQKSTVIHSIGKRQLSLSLNYMKLEPETITLLAIKDISNELSEKESESWSKLTRVLTHEIMNTIAPIVSLAQTLSARPQTDEKVTRGLNVIREQSERLMEFTASYRHLSYLPDPIKKTFSLTTALHNLEILLQSDFETAHIRFTLHSIPNDITVEGDEKQLSQVFLNLLKNSIQALEGKIGGKNRNQPHPMRKITHLYNGQRKRNPSRTTRENLCTFLHHKNRRNGNRPQSVSTNHKKHGGNFYLQESQKRENGFCHRMAGNSLSTDFHNIIEYHFLRQ